MLWIRIRSDPKLLADLISFGSEMNLKRFLFVKNILKIFNVVINGRSTKVKFMSRQEEKIYVGSRTNSKAESGFEKIIPDQQHCPALSLELTCFFLGSTSAPAALAGKLRPHPSSTAPPTANPKLGQIVFLSADTSWFTIPLFRIFDTLTCMY